MITDPQDETIGRNKISNNQHFNADGMLIKSDNRGGNHIKHKMRFQGIRIIMNVTDMNKLMEENKAQ